MRTRFGITSKGRTTLTLQYRTSATGLRADGMPSEPLTDVQRTEVRRYQQNLDKGLYRRTRMERCPLCNTDAGFVVAEKDCYGIPLQTVACRLCGLVRSYDPLDTESFRIFYRDQFRRLSEGKASPADLPDSATRFERDVAGFFERHFNRYFRLNSSSRVAEVGAGAGWNLLSFQRRGIPNVGCDFDEDYLAVGQARTLNLVKGDAQDLIRAGYRADVVLLIHVIEHFTDPISSLVELRPLLKENGYLYVETPGLRSLFYGTASGDIGSRLQTPHTFFFERWTLDRCLERAGFQPIRSDEWIGALYRKSHQPVRGLMRLPARGKKVLLFLYLLRITRLFWKIAYKTLRCNYLSRRAWKFSRIAYALIHPDWAFERYRDRLAR